MEGADLAWLADVLPTVMGSTLVAEQAADRALAASASASASESELEPRIRAGAERRAAFWAALGWEIADVLQARWAFGELTLEEATLLSHELAEHLVSVPYTAAAASLEQERCG